MAVVKAGSLEVWHLPDGRVLLHQHGRGAQTWIEVQPEALPWLIEQLQSFMEAKANGQGDS